MKYLRLFEEHINEIGDASAKTFKVQGPSPKQVLKDMLRTQENRKDSPIDWLDPEVTSTWTFSGDKGVDYEMSTNRKLGFCRVAKNKKDLSKLINLSKNKKNKFWYEQQTNFQKNYPNINKSTIKAFKIIAKKRNETM